VFSFNINKGLGGTPGPGGNPGTPGHAGTVGVGGNPGASTCGIYGQGGAFGLVKENGNFHDEAWRGIRGDDGDPGSYSLNPVSSGGGGGGEPGGGGNGCTNYYYVEYISWDGGLTWEYVGEWPAGCF
jgi:hypothetical protein